MSTVERAQLTICNLSHIPYRCASIQSIAGALWGLVPRLVITSLEDVTQGLMYLCLYLVGKL